MRYTTERIESCLESRGFECIISGALCEFYAKKELDRLMTEGFEARMLRDSPPFMFYVWAKKRAAK